MDVSVAVADGYPGEWICDRGFSDSRTTYWLRNQVKNNFAYSLPTHDQDKETHDSNNNIMENGQGWQPTILELLDSDQIKPTLSSADTRVFRNNDDFRQQSVVTIDSNSSGEVSRDILPSDISSRRFRNSSARASSQVVESENISDPKYESVSTRVERLIKLKKARGMARIQLLNPKPDSEVSAETRKRRAAGEKRRLQRQRDQDNLLKRQRNLETNGVQSDRPCSECHYKGRQCIVQPEQSLSTVNNCSEPISITLGSSLPNFVPSAADVFKCVYPPTASGSGSSRTFACITCRKRRRRCQRSKSEPDGPCDACRGRVDKTNTIPQAPKPIVLERCLECLKHKRACKILSGDTEVVEKIENREAVVRKDARLRGGKDIVGVPVYSKQWYYAKTKYEREKILQNLIDSTDLYLRSGMTRPGGPCTRCLSLGLKCMIIRLDSVASFLSPKTIRCSNCLGDVGARIAGPWKGLRVCCSAKEGQILSITRGDTLTSNLQLCESASGTGTTKIPLKDTDGGSDTQLREFRRKSVRNFAYSLPKQALDPHDVSAKMDKMYYWIRRLSDSAFNLSDLARGRQPLSECELLQLESLTATQSFPTVLTALQQLLGVSTLGDVRRQIHKFSLEAVPYMQVVRAVTSMTVYNLIFQEDPFAHDLQTALIIRILEDPIYNPQNAGITLQWHHIRTLEDDENFQAKLHAKAKVAGESIWNVLEPLITLGLSDPAPNIIKDCRTFCSNIAEIACMLNAAIKARCNQPQIFWPVSGDSFDEECLESYLGSRLDDVQLALIFGIKLDHASRLPTVYAKSKVTGR